MGIQIRKAISEEMQKNIRTGARHKENWKVANKVLTETEGNVYN